MDDFFNLSFLDNTFLNSKFLGNTLKSYLLFIVTLTLGMLILSLIKKIIVKRVYAATKRTKTDIDDMLIRIVHRYLLPVLYLGLFYASISMLTLHETIAQIIKIATIAVAVFLGARIVIAIVLYLADKFWTKKTGESGHVAAKWMSVIIKIIIWGAALMLFMENIGVNITALIAGLGIGGLAVAFAAQAILEDIFSFITIFLDRPFEVGDFIAVDDYLGNVEHIGIKTTRLRSISGEQLVFSNKDLTSSRLKNYKSMENRRIVFRIVVAYDTSVENLKLVPKIIERIIAGVERTEFNRAHFYSFDDSGLMFEIVYYVQSSDFDVYMSVQQEVNLKIKEEFEKNAILFSFPTRALYMRNENRQTKGQQD